MRIVTKKRQYFLKKCCRFLLKTMRVRQALRELMLKAA